MYPSRAASANPGRSPARVSGAASRLAALALLALVPAACVASPEDGDELGDVSEEQVARELSQTRITTASTYDAMATEGGGFGQSGRSMKFLIDNRNAGKPAIYFVNGNFKERGVVPEYAKFHYFFAQKKLGITESGAEFNASTYFTQKKRYYAGTIQTYLLGDDTQPTYAVQLYPSDAAAEETILTALQVIKPAFAIKGAKLAFVSTGPLQTTAKVGPKMRALGFTPLTVENVLGSVKYLPMNAGEAWGFLRIFPKDENALRPTDIAVFDELPLDLSVVAGTITKALQDVNSHVNLKSKERKTPNMVLRDASPTHALLAKFADKPVHMVVGKSGFTIEATTAAVVQQKFDAHMKTPWISLPVVAETRLSTYDEMCPSLSPACLELTSRFGGKAQGLGFLANKSVVGRAATAGTLSAKLGYDVSSRGFGVPVAFYRDFVADPANSAVKAKIDALILEERSGALSPNERRVRVEEIQKLFLNGKVPAAHADAIVARVASVLPGIKKIKVRSSGNAEDIPSFDGAGLYDSFSAEPAEVDNPDGSCALVEDKDGVVTKLKVKPKTVLCAVKAVYASNWNQRAVEERSFARLDHATAAMGLSIVPAYDLESDIVANTVVVTRVINGADILGYSLSVQKGENLVTNPDPGTISESTIAIFGDPGEPTQFTTARFATPVAGKPALGKPVLSAAQMTSMTDIAQAVEVAYCRTKKGYYSGDCRYVAFDPDKPRSLDMEFKVLANGHFVLKQVREFHGQ